VRLFAAAGAVAVAEVAIGAVLVASAISDDAQPTATEMIGRSVEGREIVATRYGDPAAPRVVLAVGVIHGDEPGGLKVIDRLRRDGAPDGVQLWLIPSVNPDGLAAGERGNAHGVDLNRNFPHRWKGGVPPSSGYYPGTGPVSEPETRAAMDLIERIGPDLSVWFHQPWGAVLACKGRPKLAARYAKLVRMRASCRGKGLRGTAISWENAEVGGTAFVVEFPKGKVSQRTARRHADAVATIAADDG
jgi:protein MpaA